MAEFTAGDVIVPVVPSAKGFIDDLKKQILPGAYNLGQAIGKDIQRGISDALKGVYEPLQEETKKRRQQAPRDGDEVGGAFARGFKRQVEAAFKSLPKAEIDADSSEAQKRVQELRTSLETLSKKTIGVDIDAKTALEELTKLQAELTALNEDAEVDVKADTAAALAQLAKIQADVDKISGKPVEVPVRVEPEEDPAAEGARQGGAYAQKFKSQVEAAFRSLPELVIDANSSPAAAKIADLRARMEALASKTVGIDINSVQAQAELSALKAELSALDGQQISADAEVDVAAALAELTALDAALERVDGKTARAEVDVDAAGALAQIALVTAALAAIPAVATAALGAGALGGVLASAGVGFAGLAAVAVPSLQRIQEAAKQQEQAVKSSAGATTSAGAAAAQAALQSMQLEDAERRITDAKTAAKQAEEGLTEARRAAKQAADDLARSVANAALSEESAALSVEEARARLAKLQMEASKPGNTVTDLELQRADLSVREAEQRHKDAIARTKQLQAEQKAADKAGIEGSKQVVAAKDKITQADKRVEDAERQLKVMQLQQAAAAKTQAASTGGVTKELVKLTPAAAAAGRQIEAFKNTYEAWQKRLEPAVLPAVTGALKVVQGLFKPLTPLISGSAKALTGLEQAASKALGGKFWTSFFSDLSKQAPTAITGLGKSLLSIGTGVAGVIKAFLPFVPTIVGGIQKAASAFATWGKGLGKSNAFQAFIAYVRQAWPSIQAIFINLSAAIKNVVSALAPIGTTALATISGIFKAIASLPPNVVRGIAVGILAIAAAVKVWAITQQILNLALKDNPIGLIITAIALVVAAVIAAYHAFPEFKAVVDAAIQGIVQVISWAWENAIKPAFEALKEFVMTVVAPAVTWLWQNVIVPAWQGISAAVTWAWNTVIQPALKALWNFVKTVLAPAVTWLWETIVKPAFTKIGEWIKTAWTTVIQPALTALWKFITETLAPKVLWLFENVVKPTFSKAGEVIKAAWETVIKPALTALWKFITEDVPNGFKKGVSMIETFWNNLKDIAKKPINFIIETVYNGGIVKVWNAVADALGLKDTTKLSAIPALAKGGIYPGYTPGKDVGLAAVSGGEAIMRPEWTRAVGEDYVHSANAAARKGGVGGVARFLGIAGDPGGAGFAGAFASGGIVGNIKEVLAGGLKIGAEKLLNPLLDQAQAAMGGSPWAKMLVGVPKKMISMVIDSIGAKEEKAGGPKAAKAIAFARAQLGKPYLWGGTGPDAFDCSGLVMRALQAAGVSGVPRVSQAQMKWVKPVQTPTPGDLGFPHPGHVWMYSSKNSIIEAPYTGANVREVAARSAQLIGRPQYDSGGYLMPGTSLVHNGTGRPEPVLTDRQWQDISRSTQGGDGSLVNIGEMHVTPEQSPYAIAQDLRFIMGQGVRSRG
ncbi:NlpC/P60 family protein [Streptosporangium jomthongense]|uniref:NlpC/P60 family protein n=1 Tax=Streptosporangium jomthongense TaxID=1193683 RepID=A0ABV8FG26_9ACTN